MLYKKVLGHMSHMGLQRKFPGKEAGAKSYRLGTENPGQQILRRRRRCEEVSLNHSTTLLSTLPVTGTS
jgi:hypothetical protein